MKKTQIPRLVTIKKAIEYFGMTDWFWRSRIWDGDIPRISMGTGGKIMMDTRDIEAFIERSKTYETPA